MEKPKKYIVRILKLTLLTVIIFKVLTALTAKREGIIDGLDSYGFPFRYSTLGEQGTFFSYPYLVLDIAFALLLSIIMLTVLKFFKSKKEAIHPR